MTAASELRVLGKAVHARLLAKHVLQATRHIDMKNEPQKEDMAIVSIQDHISREIHSLVFDRVRISGTVVFQCSIDVDGSKEDVFFLDDATGIIPFVLQRFECDYEPTDVGSDLDKEIQKAMRRRLEIGSTCATGFLVGKTIEVLGSIRWSILENSTWSLPIWIEGCQVNIKNEPMSETQALLETLATYRFYFPKCSAFMDTE